MSETKETKAVRKSIAFTLGIVCILLIAGLGGAMAYYTIAINNKDNKVNSQKATISQLNATIEDQNNTINQLNTNVTNLQNQTTALQKQLNSLHNTTDSLYYDLYHYEFGNVSFRNPNYNFSPPVSMYHALWIALKSDGWNASSLSDKTVSVFLNYMEFVSNPSYNGSEVLYEVTQPVEDYSPVQVNDTTYRYMWVVVVSNQVGESTAILYLVDAATAEVQHNAFPP